VVYWDLKLEFELSVSIKNLDDVNNSYNSNNSNNKYLVCHRVTYNS